MKPKVGQEKPSLCPFNLIKCSRTPATYEIGLSGNIIPWPDRVAGEAVSVAVTGRGASAPWGLGGLQVQRVLRQVPPPAAPGDRLICLVQLKITRSDDALKCIHIIARSRINYFADCLAPFMTYMLPDL